MSGMGLFPDVTVGPFIAGTWIAQTRLFEADVWGGRFVEKSRLGFTRSHALARIERVGMRQVERNRSTESLRLDPSDLAKPRPGGASVAHHPTEEAEIADR